MKNIDKVIKTILFSVRHVYTLYTPIIPYLNLYIIIIYSLIIWYCLVTWELKHRGFKSLEHLITSGKFLFTVSGFVSYCENLRRSTWRLHKNLHKVWTKLFHLMYITFLFEIQFNLNIILSIVFQTNSWIWKSHCPVNPRRLSNGYIEASLC